MVKRIQATAFDGSTAYGARSLFPIGFMMLFDDDTRPLSWANRFMLKAASALIRDGKDWQQSQKAECDDLGVFSLYLEAQNISFPMLKETNIIEFAQCLLLSVSPRTRKKFAVTTVRRRINTIVRCCESNFQDGTFAQPIITYVKKAAKSIVSKAQEDLTAPTPIADLPSAPAADTHVAPFATASLHRLLARLGPDPTEQHDLFSCTARAGVDVVRRPRRNRIIVELACTTGLREDEIAHLTLIQILNLPDPDDIPAHGFARLKVTHTKGTKDGWVLIPQHILRQLLDYIEGERAEIIVRAKEISARKGRQFREQKYLFLNGLDSNGRDIGRRCTKANISRFFRDAVVAVGLFRREERFVLDDDFNPMVDNETGHYLAEVLLVPAHSFHDLRHTFAVTAYKALISAGVAEPIRMLKTLLRHSLAETTVRIYLRWLDLNEASLSDDLSRLLRGATKWYA